MSTIPIITIEGPTAVGKSTLALDLAEAMNSEIISADSRQVYRFLNIGTAKPTPAETARIPHHLIDIVNPDQQYTAGQFCRDAAAHISRLDARGIIPIVAGGTGFYIKSLLEGLASIPPIAPEIREELRNVARLQGEEALRKRLLEADPASARRINSGDIQKMLRALEVYESTGKTITQHWQEQKDSPPYAPFKILFTADRAELYSRINARMDAMIEMGLLKEIDNLLQQYQMDDPGMITVGYREFYPYFRGEKPLASCLEMAKQNSRNYAKRQLTWYRKQFFDLTITNKTVIFSELVEQIDCRINKGD